MGKRTENRIEIDKREVGLGSNISSVFKQEKQKLDKTYQ